jgi:hypothetical protein
LIEPNETCSAETPTQTKNTPSKSYNHQYGWKKKLGNEKSTKVIRHSQGENSNVTKKGQDKAKRCTKY